MWAAAAAARCLRIYKENNNTEALCTMQAHFCKHWHFNWNWPKKLGGINYLYDGRLYVEQEWKEGGEDWKWSQLLIQFRPLFDVYKAVQRLLPWLFLKFKYENGTPSYWVEYPSGGGPRERGGVCFQADWHWLFLGGNMTFRANCNFLDKPELNLQLQYCAGPAHWDDGWFNSTP